MKFRAREKNSKKTYLHFTLNDFKGDGDEVRVYFLTNSRGTASIELYLLLLNFDIEYEHEGKWFKYE